MTKITKNNTQRTNAYQKVYTPENCRLEPQNWWFVGVFFLLQEGIYRFHVGFHGCTWTTNTPKHSMGLGVLCISPTNLPTKKKTTLKSCKTKTGWWLNQPIWKIFVKMGSSSPGIRGENKKMFELPPPGIELRCLANPWVIQVQGSRFRNLPILWRDNSPNWIPSEVWAPNNPYHPGGPKQTPFGEGGEGAEMEILVEPWKQFCITHPFSWQYFLGHVERKTLGGWNMWNIGTVYFSFKLN